MDIERDLATIARQESALVLKQFDTDIAWALGSHLRALAKARNAPGAMDVRRFGHVLFYATLPGTTPDNAEWIRRKSNVVQRLLRSSYAVGLKLQLNGQTLASKYALSEADYACHGGCFPLSVEGSGIIGSVAFSGLPQREDHELVVQALCEFTGNDYKSLALDPQ